MARSNFTEKERADARGDAIIARAAWKTHRQCCQECRGKTCPIGLELFTACSRAMREVHRTHGHTGYEYVESRDNGGA